MTDDRRAQPRVRELLEVNWRWTSGNRRSRIANLSAGGCLVEAVGEIPLGERLSLQLKLPLQGRISVDGEVIRCEPGKGFAVRFVDLTNETREALKRAVKNLRATA